MDADPRTLLPERLQTPEGGPHADVTAQRLRPAYAARAEGRAAAVVSGRSSGSRSPGWPGPTPTVPVFTANRLTGLASSSAPAASPRLRRRPSPWPSHRHRKPGTKSTPRPMSAGFEPVTRLRSFTTDSCRIPSDLARRTQPVWQYQTVPALSALLPALPGVSRIRLRPAPTGLLRQPSEEALHLPRFPAPHGALRPRVAMAAVPARPGRHDGRHRLLPCRLRGDPPPPVLPVRRRGRQPLRARPRSHAQPGRAVDHPADPQPLDGPATTPRASSSWSATALGSSPILTTRPWPAPASSP